MSHMHILRDQNGLLLNFKISFWENYDG